MARKDLLRLDNEAHGMFSARSLRLKRAEEDAQGVHVCIWRSYEGEHPDVRGMALDAAQTIALRDALVEHTKSW